MKTGLIIAGGSIDDAFVLDYMKDNAGRFDEIIAVDGALETAKRLGVEPTIIVGDFDTVSKRTLEEFKQTSQAKWIRLQPEKDATDMEMALDSALEAGCKNITFLGALGGRMDHALANIHLLYKAEKQGAHCQILDCQNRIQVLTKTTTFHKTEAFGTYISFIPLSTHVKGLTLRGFKYPLSGYDLTIGVSLGVSNELAEEECTAEFKEGVLLCLETRDETSDKISDKTRVEFREARV